jgi:hypothetical protein
MQDKIHIYELIKDEKDIIDFILNGFLHSTILFVFLTILYYFIVSPLTQKLLHDEIGHLIDNIFNDEFPEPVTINIKNILTNQLSLEKFTSSPQFSVNNINDNQYTLAGLSNNYINTNLQNTINNAQTQVNTNIQNNINNNVQAQVNSQKAKYINPNLMNNLIETNSKPNSLISINNQNVMYHIIYVSFCLFLITCILMIYFKYNFPKSVNLSHVLSENLILFMIIGYIEYYFFTTYAFKYSPLLPSELSTLLNASISKNINTPFKYNDPSITPPYEELPIPIIFF